MAATRERITTATNELFRHRGYHGTSLKDVVAGSGATIGSIYHFFPEGKVALAEATLAESGLAYQALFETIYDEAGDADEAVRAFFDGAADVLEATDYADICPIATVAHEVAGTDERLRTLTATVFSSWEVSLRSRLKGSGFDESDAVELSITLLAVLEGAFLLARVHRNGDIVRIAGRRAVALLAGAADSRSGS